MALVERVFSLPAFGRQLAGTGLGTAHVMRVSRRRHAGYAHVRS